MNRLRWKMSEIIFKCCLCDCIVTQEDKSVGKRKMAGEFKVCKECDGSKEKVND